MSHWPTHKQTINLSLKAENFTKHIDYKYEKLPGMTVSRYYKTKYHIFSEDLVFLYTLHKGGDTNWSHDGGVT